MKHFNNICKKNIFLVKINFAIKHILFKTMYNLSIIFNNKYLINME